jgi:hypothetical protein
MKIPDYKIPSGSALGSDSDNWGTAFTEPLDTKTLPRVIDGSRPIYVYGVIQYFDIFDQYHETGYCWHRLPDNGPFMSCEYGNWSK